ncbi:MAG: hypothetical protein Q7J24_11955 [Desulfomicrobium sp.]|nr:hypothetical protein [Desulfomicrobium sp.]
MNTKRLPVVLLALEVARPRRQPDPGRRGTKESYEKNSKLDLEPNPFKTGVRILYSRPGSSPESI